MLQVTKFVICSIKKLTLRKKVKRKNSGNKEKTVKPQGMSRIIINYYFDSNFKITPSANEYNDTTPNAHKNVQTKIYTGLLDSIS